MGTSIKLEEGQEVLQSIRLKVPKIDQNMCQILGFVQDTNNGEILAAGYTDMIDGKFYAYDSKNNLIKYNIRQQKNYFPVRMCITPHPSDFNGDAKINETDLFLLIKKFGTRKGDKDYHERYNICDIGFSKDRIDILDIVRQNREIITQERLQKEINAANQRQIVLSHPPPPKKKTSELLGVDMMITHIQPLL